MSRKRILIILAVLAVLLATAVVGGWWYMAIGRFPLGGVTHHDFGDVAVVGAGTTRQHTFVLENRTGGPVRIEAVRPSCSCLLATASTLEVAPGATVDIVADFDFGEAGHKKKRIAIIFADGPPMNLWIGGTGVRPLRVRADRMSVSLDGVTPVILPLTAAVQDSDDAPADPVLVAPTGVGTRFLGWKRSSAQDTERRWAAKWRAQLELTWNGTALPPGAELVITVEPEMPIVVRLISVPD